MIKIKKFEGCFVCPDPQKAMEKFIEKNGIRREQIINVDNTTTVVGRGRLAQSQVILTYEA